MKSLPLQEAWLPTAALRAAMEEACKKAGWQFYHPSPIFCTDNAAMIGAAAYYEYLAGTSSGWISMQSPI